MENQILECNAIVEYSNKDGLVTKKIYKPCILRLVRNNFREIFLEVRGDKRKINIRHQLKNVKIYRKFMNEGKATIRFEDDRVTVMISNAPPSLLFSFLKVLVVKLISGCESDKNVTEKLLSSKHPGIENISPVTVKDIEKAKNKINYPGKTPTGVTETFKRPPKSEKESKAEKNCLMAMTEQNLSQEQQEIFDAARNGFNIFFTGGAGTGKSHLLKIIVAALPPETTFVTASTGVAASQLGGITLHQFAGLGTGEGTIEKCVALASRPNVRAVWKKCKHLIVDEISMVHGHFFEKLEHVARVVRNSKKPFGGIQLILCGDFFQLPPVSDKIVFCFETEAWEKCITKCFELTEIYRQNDPVFISILENIRVGIVTDSMRRRLLKTRAQNIEKDGILATRLCTHTADAIEINKAKLNELTGEMKTYRAIDNPSWLSQVIDKHCPVPSFVVLKVNAQVMLMKNIDFAKGLVNGARGVVLRFDTDDLPIVKFNSFTYKIQKAKFVTKLASGEILIRLQIPLNLAWAFSIHKSQGLTLDCVEISLSKVFEAGLAYVALSRVRSLDCLRIIDFDPGQVWAHEKVLQYYEIFQKNLEIAKSFKLLYN